MLLLALSAASILAGAAGFVVAMPPRGIPFILLAFGLSAWGACVASVGLAGLLGVLTPSALALFAVAWLAAGILAAWRSGQAPDLGTRLRRSATTARAVAGWPPVAAGLAIVGLSLAWRAVLAVRLPVVDILGWQYHLVLADVWIQSEALVRVSQNLWTDGWPATGELLTAWLMAFTRSDALAGFTSLLPLPLAIVACAGLAREIGASRRSATLAGLLLGMTPAWLALAGTSYPDPGLATAVVAAWWLGLRLLRGERNVVTALLFGIASGLAIGAKGSSLVLVGPIVAGVGLALLVETIRQMRARTGWVDPFAAGIGILVPIVILGASWYLKNALVHGNPLFPVGFGPFAGEAEHFGAPPMPAQLLEQSLPGQLFRSWTYDWHLTEYPYNVRPGGFGHAWPAGLALAAIGLGWLVDRRRAAAIGLVVLPGVAALALVPSAWYARYTLFLPALGWALAALAIDRLRARSRTVVGLLLVAVATVSVAFANALPNVRLSPQRDTLATRSAQYLELVLSGSSQERSAINHRGQCARMDVIPEGTRVVVESAYLVPHAAIGPRLQRTLVQPPPETRTIPELVAYLRVQDATWLVTRAETELDRLVSSRPTLFERRARSCHGARIWAVIGFERTAGGGP